MSQCLRCATYALQTEGSSQAQSAHSYAAWLSCCDYNRACCLQQSFFKIDPVTITVTQIRTRKQLKTVSVNDVSHSFGTLCVNCHCFLIIITAANIKHKRWARSFSEEQPNAQLKNYDSSPIREPINAAKTENLPSQNGGLLC